MEVLMVKSMENQNAIHDVLYVLRDNKMWLNEKNYI